jgi:hypothetical protein
LYNKQQRLLVVQVSFLHSMSMTTLGQVKKTTNTIFTLEIIQYALKGQKFLAQGIALGNYERQPVALKGQKR